MTDKRFTIKEFSTLDAMVSIDVICDNGIELPQSTACDLLNELSEENEGLKKQMERLYNYFVDWHSDIMGANQFSEMWDDVKEDEE